MKKQFLIFPLFLLIPIIIMPSQSFATNTIKTGMTYYVDATNGDDGNIGTSPEMAFKTIARAKEYFAPGNTILLKRGQTWREQIYIENSGTANNPITFDAYGSGAKPLLLGSITMNNPSDWTDIGGNLWATADSSFQYDVGFVLLGEESKDNVGIKRDFLDEIPSDAKDEYGNWFIEDGVDAEKEYWYDEENQRVILYCEQNPTLEYSNIEIANTARWEHMVRGVENIQYITIKNLELKYFNAHGITFINSQGIIIKNCDISYGGGTYLEKKVRYGNGIEFWNNAADCLVEGCKIGMMYDAAVTNQGTAENHVAENISYIGNIFWNCEYSLEAWARPSSATIRNVYFENNTCLGAGFGWGHFQRYDPHGWHMAFWGNEAEVESLYVRYNVFYESISSAFYRAMGNEYDGLLLDYNYYYETAGYVISYEGPKKDYEMDQFSKYQNKEGQDLHSVAGDKTEVQNAARTLVNEEDLDFLNNLLEATNDLAQEYSDQEVKPGGIPGITAIILTSALLVIFLWSKKKRHKK
ncbi:MAG: hypothetical protein GF308_06250 [Candidatus Heimdallarchaeota archaeon]|nr:hypothetical protein [Candidatus Heimdallarchaeota archaeon]